MSSQIRGLLRELILETVRHWENKENSAQILDLADVYGEKLESYLEAEADKHHEEAKEYGAER